MDVKFILPIPEKETKTYYSEEAYPGKALVAYKVQAYMPLVGQEAPFRASYAVDDISLKKSAPPTNDLDILEADTRKEDRRIRIHEQPRLELQNLLRTMEVKSEGGQEPPYAWAVVGQVGEE
jgi:hypothetical protein